MDAARKELIGPGIGKVNRAFLPLGLSPFFPGLTLAASSAAPKVTETAGYKLMDYLCLTTSCVANFNLQHT